MTHDPVARLLAVATDDEADVIYELMVRSGLFWKCECGFINNADEHVCDGCGAQRKDYP